MAKQKAEGKKEQPAVPARRGVGNAQAPRQRRYRFRDHGRTTSRIPDDNLTIRTDGPAVEIMRPTFEEGPTVFRAFPMLCAEDPSTYDPWRESVDELAFGDWIRDYPIASFVGTRSKKTWILFDPADQTYERNHNPYVIFANTVINGVKKKGAGAGRWNSLVAGISKDAAVKWPTVMYVIQGLCYARGGKIYVNDGPPRGAGDEDLPLINQLPKSAGEELVAKLDMLNPKFKGPEDDYDHMFKYGDPVSFDKGRFITIYNPAKGDGTMAAPQSDKRASWEVGKKRKGEGRGEETISRYAVKLTGAYRTAKGEFRANELAEKEEFFRKRIVWWDDVMRIPSHEEQYLFIAQAFADVPDMFEYAFSDYSEAFNDDIRKVLRSSVSGPGAAVPTDEDDAPTQPARRSSASLPARTAAPKGGPADDEDDPDEDDPDEDLDDEGLDEDEDTEDESGDVAVDEATDDDAEDSVADDDENDAAEEDESADDDGEDAPADDEDDVDEDVDEDDVAEDDVDEDDVDEDAQADDDDAVDDSDDDEANVDEDEAALEAATRAAENRSSRRDAPTGKTGGTGSAPAQPRGDKKADTKPASAGSKEIDMAAKKGAKAKPAKKASPKKKGK